MASRTDSKLDFYDKKSGMGLKRRCFLNFDPVRTCLPITTPLVRSILGRDGVALQALRDMAERSWHRWHGKRIPRFR